VGADPADDCLDKPTAACIARHYAKDADLRWQALPPSETSTPTAWLLDALIKLGELDEAERVARREKRGAYSSDRASDIAIARFLASVHAGAPNFDLLVRLANPDADLAPLLGSQPPEALPLGPQPLASVASLAYWRAASALLARFADGQGIDEAQKAPLEERVRFRASPVWQGLMAGFLHWTERGPIAARHLNLRFLAEFHLVLGDASSAKAALERIGSAPATDEEVEIWWRLGDLAHADARARSSTDAMVLGRHLVRVARAAIASGDRTTALTVLGEAWTIGTQPKRGRVLYANFLRQLVQLTDQAGDRPLAILRARAIRDLPESPILLQEHWVDAAAAMNDIGAHKEAAQLLHELIAQDPESLAAAGLSPLTSAPPATTRPRRKSFSSAAPELFRAGLRDAARRLFYQALATVPQSRPRPIRPEDVEALFALGGQRVPRGAAEQIARQQGLSRRLHWASAPMPVGADPWFPVLASEAANPDRVADVLELTSSVSSDARVALLISAARDDARFGRTSTAVARLKEVVALLTFVDQPYHVLCDAMGQAGKLKRDDIADVALRVAVDAARTEPEEVRAAILVYSAACRTAKRSI
jgi:tetratricopeptide (TPR) repeat protein